MKIVVIGGTGLIGSQVVAKLTQHGHEAIAAAPNTGVNTLTGEGLAEALTGAQVVVDVANSPSFEDGPAWDFFTTATGNVLTAAESAGVSHLVARTAVGQPVGGILEVAGPDRYPLDDHTLVPGSDATVFPTRFADWLVDNAPVPVR